MNAIRDLAGTLRAAAARRSMTQTQLRTQAGVSQRTLTNVLSGEEDFKVSTLLALADRLGLEVALIPKGAAVAVGAGETSEPLVKSRVASALERVRAARER
jgi:transcriptional regulator with XRE-family HTH domain